jgi:hypothetical protein
MKVAKSSVLSRTGVTMANALSAPAGTCPRRKRWSARTLDHGQSDARATSRARTGFKARRPHRREQVGLVHRHRCDPPLKQLARLLGRPIARRATQETRRLTGPPGIGEPTADDPIADIASRELILPAAAAKSCAV